MFLSVFVICICYCLLFCFVLFCYLQHLDFDACFCQDVKGFLKQQHKLVTSICSHFILYVPHRVNEDIILILIHVYVKNYKGLKKNALQFVQTFKIYCQNWMLAVEKRSLAWVRFVGSPLKKFYVRHLKVGSIFNRLISIILLYNNSLQS